MAERRFLVLKFEIDQDQNLSDDEIHDMGERIVADLFTVEPVTFAGTDILTGRQWGSSVGRLV